MCTYVCDVLGCNSVFMNSVRTLIHLYLRTYVCWYTVVYVYIYEPVFLHRVYVYMCYCGMCVCMCVCERESSVPHGSIVTSAQVSYSALAGTMQ